MPARFIAYPPDSPAVVRLLEDDTSYRIGRGSDCEICVEHASVSRFHAEIRGRSNAWHLHDTGSKNGLRMDGHLVLESNMARSTWFSIGDVHCAFEPLDEAAAFAHQVAGLSRRSESRALSIQLQPGLGMSTLMPQTIDVVLQLSGLERGFMLYAAAGERLRIRASRGLRPSDIAGNHFAGSVAAVDRALASGSSVICCDTTESPWLGARPSVRLGGIRALICVPLATPGGSTGVIYADSRKPGPPVTELDLELVETIASHASTAIEAACLQERIDHIVAAVEREEAQAPLWEDLHQPADRQASD